MKKTYYYWFSLLLLLATTSGWAQTFVPILERKVFRPVSEVSGEAKLTVSGDYLYFVGRDGSTGPELWRTDGTPGGTKLVKDITPGPEYGFNTPTSLFDMNGTLYFFAGPALYKTDGTEAGTVLIRQFGDIGGGNLLSYNGLLIFIIENGLWRTDGTPEGTYRIAKRPSFNPKVYNGILYFLSASGPTFQETDLLRSDGTLAGTSLVTQLPGTVQSFGIGSDGFYLTSLTGNFHATPGQWRTWRSDGTATGTVQLGPVTSTSQPGYFNAFGDLYQRQNEVGLVPTRRQNKATGAFELVTPTPNIEVLQRGVPYNGQIYGNAYQPATGQELSRLDGSLVRDLNPGSETGILMQPVVANGLLYFTGNDGTTGFELWQSDGSAGGTRLTGDLFPGRSSYPLDLTVYKGELYFDTWEGTLFKLNPQQTPPTDPTPPTQPTGSLAFSTPSYDCNTGQLTVMTMGGNGSPIEYRIIGLRDWSTSASFSVPTWQRSETTFTLDIRQSGQVLSQSFTTSCTPTTTPPPSDPNPPTTPPATGGELSITAPDYDCSNGQLTVQTTGGSGSSIEYRVIGLRDWSASNRFDVPTWQRSGTEFTLDVRQDGKVISRSFTSGCDRARVSAREKGQTLGVILYPNPVTEQFTVEVSGAVGQTVHFDVVNLNGRSMIKQSRQVDDDGHIERLTMPADAASGLYLLKVSADKQTKIIKVVKQ